MTEVPVDDRFSCIDAHTHVFPPEIVSEPGRFLSRDAWFGALYRSPKARLVSAEQLIESMDLAGIGRSVLCGFPWSSGGLCQRHNDYMAESVSRFPDRLAWLAIASPAGGDAGLEQTRVWLSEGAAGIGELNADAQGFDFDGDWLLAVADLCRQFDRPLMLHTSEPVGHLYPGKGTATPEPVCAFLQLAPGVKVIAAHWGGGLPFYELMPEIRKLASDVVYDSAASTYLYDPAVFRTVLDIVGPRKVLFASDYPILRQERFLNKVMGLPWRSREERDAVLFRNAAELFRWPGVDAGEGLK